MAGYLYILKTIKLCRKWRGTGVLYVYLVVRTHVAFIEFHLSFFFCMKETYDWQCFMVLFMGTG